MFYTLHSSRGGYRRDRFSNQFGVIDFGITNVSAYSGESATINPAHLSLGRRYTMAGQEKVNRPGLLSAFRCFTYREGCSRSGRAIIHLYYRRPTAASLVLIHAMHVDYRAEQHFGASICIGAQGMVILCLCGKGHNFISISRIRFRIFYSEFLLSI